MRLKRTLDDGSTIIEIFDTEDVFIGNRMEFLWGYSFHQDAEYYDVDEWKANHKVVEEIALGNSKILDIESEEAYILVKYWFKLS